MQELPVTTTSVNQRYTGTGDGVEGPKHAQKKHVIVLSVGQGKNRPDCTRLEVEDLLEMNAIDPMEESWWSGHLWKGDKRKKDQWQAMTVAMADIDHPKPPGARPNEQSHAPAEKHSKIVLEALPGDCVYLTPNG